MESLVEAAMRRRAEERRGPLRQEKDGGERRRRGGTPTNVWLAPERLEEIKRQAARLDRSISWLLSKAWDLAAPTVRRMETPPSREEE